MLPFEVAPSMCAVINRFGPLTRKYGALTGRRPPGPIIVPFHVTYPGNRCNRELGNPAISRNLLAQRFLSALSKTCP